MLVTYVSGRRAERPIEIRIAMAAAGRPHEVRQCEIQWPQDRHCAGQKRIRVGGSDSGSVKAGHAWAQG